MFSLRLLYFMWFFSARSSVFLLWLAFSCAFSLVCCKFDCRCSHCLERLLSEMYHYISCGMLTVLLFSLAHAMLVNDSMTVATVPKKVMCFS